MDVTTYVILLTNNKRNEAAFLAPSLEKGYTRNVDEAMTITFENMGEKQSLMGKSALEEAIYGAVNRLSTHYISGPLEKFMQYCLNHNINPEYGWRYIKKEEAQDYIDINYPTPRKYISKKTRELVYEKYHGHCAYCGKPISMKEMQVDHFLAHMGGKGQDHIDNYMPACRDCNAYKLNFTIDQFRDMIIRDALRIHQNRKQPKEYLADRIVKAYGLDIDIPWERQSTITFYYEKEDK